MERQGTAIARNSAIEAIAKKIPSEIAPQIEGALIAGDLKGLSPEQRVQFYHLVCESVGLNPLTRPFDYIVLNGKLTMYARKDATDQLRRIHSVSVEIVSREFIDDLYIVKAKGFTAEGRQDESLGAIAIKGLQGEARANAIMKAETKAKRRVTLSMCGLGFLDEAEVDSTSRKPAFTYESVSEPVPVPQLSDTASISTAVPTPSTNLDCFDIDDIRDIETACDDAEVPMADVREQCRKQGFSASMEDVPKVKKAVILKWIEGKRKETDHE